MPQHGAEALPRAAAIVVGRYCGRYPASEVSAIAGALDAVTDAHGKPEHGATHNRRPSEKKYETGFRVISATVPGHSRLPLIFRTARLWPAKCGGFEAATCSRCYTIKNGSVTTERRDRCRREGEGHLECIADV